MIKQRKMYKHIVIVSSRLSRFAFEDALKSRGGRVSDITDLGDKVLYEVAFPKRNQRDEFASWWRQRDVKKDAGDRSSGTKAS